LLPVLVTGCLDQGSLQAGLALPQAGLAHSIVDRRRSQLQQRLTHPGALVPAHGCRVPGVNVMIAIFGDFRQLSAKISAFSREGQCYDPFCWPLASSNLRVFWRKFVKIITLAPERANKMARGGRDKNADVKFRLICFRAIRAATSDDDNFFSFDQRDANLRSY
jgi:hypothetical protein